MITLPQLLKAVIDKGASDLHIVADSPPVMRINGKVVRVKYRNLNSDESKSLCYSVLTDAQKSRFEESKELDFSFAVKKAARFRANIFFQNGHVSGAFRKIPFEVPKFSSLGLPGAVGEMVNSVNGLVLVTGPTGSGKSTTIAALIDKINREKQGHIITLEDPIEYLHKHKNCIINQREIGPDTWSYHAAIKSLLRQDPDYCLVGELRDPETVEGAIKLAETGHLVFATLHTNSAIQSISRIVTIYPAEQQDRVRVTLSFILQGIISQQLLPGKDGRICLAAEVLLPTPGIRNLIREDKLHQAYGMMQVGQDKTGMVTMNQTLLSLLVKRKIDVGTAFSASADPTELDQMMKKAGI